MFNKILDKEVIKIVKNDKDQQHVFIIRLKFLIIVILLIIAILIFI